MITTSDITLVRALALLGVVSAVLAHGHEDIATMGMGTGHDAQSHFTNTTSSANMTTPSLPQSYYTYSDHSSLMLAHVAFMTVGWFFVLPIGAPNLHIFIRNID